MKIAIIDQDELLTDRSRSRTKERLLFALCRFSNRIEQVRMLLFYSVDNDRINSICQITVKMAGSRSSSVVIKTPEMTSAITTAITKIERNLTWRFDWWQSWFVLYRVLPKIDVAPQSGLPISQSP